MAECKKMKNKQNGNTTSIPENILVDEKNRIVFCSIPKNACSSWKYFFIQRNNASAILGKSPLNGTGKVPFVHSKDTLLSSNLRPFRNFNIKEREHIQRNYPKFLVSRHPLARLVSAYRDKLEHHGPVNNFMRILLPLLGKSINSKSSITFTEFVDYLLKPSSEKRDYRNNEHWRPYTDLCLPCYLNYSYVIRYENFDDDADHVLHLLYNASLKSLPHKNQQQSGLLDEDYLSNLTKKQLQGLRERYYWDFHLFAYK